VAETYIAGTSQDNICKLCGLSISSPGELQTHVRKEHPLFSWRGEIFPYAMLHLAMAETYIAGTSQDNICKLCGLSYSPPERLQTHVRKEHPLFNPRRQRFSFTRSAKSVNAT
jgi:Zinc finger, C2H2 type